MAVMTAKKVEEIARAANPKVALIQAVGDLTQEVVLSDLVLIATYIRPEKTTGGIIRPIDNIKEDEFQGKVGLIVSKGPLAYDDLNDDGTTESTCNVGDWVVFSIKDGWAVTVNGTACRLIPYERIRMKISNPDVVF